MIPKAIAASTLSLSLILSGCATGLPKPVEHIMDWGVAVPKSYLKKYNVKDNSNCDMGQEHEAKCITEWYALKQSSPPYEYVSVVAPAFISKDAAISWQSAGALGTVVFLLVQREGRRNMELFVEACKHKYAKDWRNSPNSQCKAKHRFFP